MDNFVEPRLKTAASIGCRNRLSRWRTIKTRWQRVLNCTLVGIGESALRTQLRAGRWRTLGARVVVMHNGPLTRRQEEWAALLAAGPGAGLAGRTSLALAGLRDWDDPAVHVLVPRGRTARSAGSVKIVVHETRLPANGQSPDDGIAASHSSSAVSDRRRVVVGERPYRLRSGCRRGSATALDRAAPARRAE